ncbi:MAG: hypothetical protein JHC33_07445 [Ignisphaera sp.]|nr:hypothetical protein [Ignisphaera sp.]
MVYIRIEAEVRPTEDIEKVLKALKNIFTFKNFKVEELGNERKLIIIEESSIDVLSKMYDGLRRQRILDTSRNIFLKNLRGDTIEIRLHKQAAYQGIISFVDSDAESPLGSIYVIISSKNINALIDWLAPKTTHGKPLWELPTPTDV